MPPSQKRLRIPEDLAERIRHFHPILKSGVKAALQDILEDPTCGKPLKEELKGLRSYRLKRFRVIYRISGDAIDIVAIGPRRIIYEETLRLLVKGEGPKK